MREIDCVSIQQMAFWQFHWRRLQILTLGLAECQANRQRSVANISSACEPLDFSVRCCLAESSTALPLQLCTPISTRRRTKVRARRSRPGCSSKTEHQLTAWAPPIYSM